MRKFFKFTITSALFLLSLLVLTACNFTPKLIAPTGLTINQNTLALTWYKIGGAVRYTVEINGAEYPVAENSYSLSPLAAGEYEIRVKAMGDKETYRDSDWSEPISFVREQESGISYRLINANTEYEVTGIGSASGNVTIDSVFRGKPVTSIGEGAFANNSRLTGVTIPESVKTIARRAFYNCAYLTTVSLPQSVESIGEYAFQSCRRLEAINLPSGLTEIPSYTFSYCRALTSITIPDGVQSIGEYAFSNCEALTAISIPDSVTTIGDYAINSERDFRKIQQKIPNKIENSLQMIA